MDGLTGVYLRGGFISVLERKRMIETAKQYLNLSKMSYTGQHLGLCSKQSMGWQKTPRFMEY